jgi:hypothetical protein
MLVGDKKNVPYDGRLERELRLIPPGPDYMADLLYMHKGQLIVGFYASGGFGKPVKGARFELLYPSSGEILRVYEPGPDLGGSMACFSDDRLTFMRIQNRT